MLHNLLVRKIEFTIWNYEAIVINNLLNRQKSFQLIVTVNRTILYEMCP